jgi:hypothetical protein
MNDLTEGRAAEFETNEDDPEVEWPLDAEPPKTQPNGGARHGKTVFEEVPRTRRAPVEVKTSRQEIDPTQIDEAIQRGLAADNGGRAESNSQKTRRERTAVPPWMSNACFDNKGALIPNLASAMAKSTPGSQKSAKTFATKPLT